MTVAESDYERQERKGAGVYEQIYRVIFEVGKKFEYAHLSSIIYSSATATATVCRFPMIISRHEAAYVWRWFFDVPL